MAISHNDRYLLATDAGFQHRVQASLITTCVSIANEGWGTPFHRERAQFVTQVLANPTGTNNNWVILFSNTVATDSNVISDATQAGTVALTTSNLAAQAALVTDSHIDTAISSEFNAFIRVPG